MRVILLAVIGLVAGIAAHAELPNEANYPNRSEMMVGNVRVVVGLSVFETEPETPLGAYLGAENMGPDPVFIPNPNGTVPRHGWTIVPEGCSSDSFEPPCAFAYYFPVYVYPFDIGITLDPGEIFERNIVWNRPSFAFVEAGLHVATGGFGRENYHFPPGGISIPITITSDFVPVEPATWGELKQRFRP